MTNETKEPELRACPFCGERLQRPYLKNPEVYKHPEGADCYAGRCVVFPQNYNAWNARADAEALKAADALSEALFRNDPWDEIDQLVTAYRKARGGE